MNEKGARSVMSSKVKLGADASVAGGPVGRTTSAETDIVMKAEILSWSRNRGIFAGISLDGSTLRCNRDANKNLYGKELNAKADHLTARGKNTSCWPAAYRIAQQNFA